MKEREQEGSLAALYCEAVGVARCVALERAAASSGGEQIDDFLDSHVGTMVGHLETAVGPVLGIGFMMKAAVGKGSAQPFVKEEEQEGNLDALGREAVGIARSIPLQ